MKRLLGLLVVTGMLVGLPLSHYVLAKGKPVKVTICHQSEEVALETEGAFTGVLITVPEHVAEKHIANHGDCYATSATTEGNLCICNGSEE